MLVAFLTLQLTLPGCSSLKEKRSLIKPVISRLHRQFNISVAEIDFQDQWRTVVLGCAIVSNDKGYAQSALQEVLRFTERAWPDLPISEFRIEVI